MVLHNNKWDRKAKFKYLKKHGLLKSQQEEEAQPVEIKSKWRPDTLEDEDDGGGISEPEKIEGGELLAKGTEENEGEAEGGEPVESLIQNVRDIPIYDDEDEDDFVKYTQMTKNARSIIDEPANPKKEKKKIDVSTANLEELLNNLDSGDEDDHGVKESKTLSSEDVEQFNALQEKIKREKVYRNIKERFHKLEKSEDTQKTAEQEAKDNLQQLLGQINLEEETREPVKQDIFSLRITEKPKALKPVSAPKSKIIIKDDNLDELLGL